MNTPQFHLKSGGAHGEAYDVTLRQPASIDRPGADFACATLGLAITAVLTFGFSGLLLTLSVLGACELLWRARVAAAMHGYVHCTLYTETGEQTELLIHRAEYRRCMQAVGNQDTVFWQGSVPPSPLAELRWRT